MDWLPSANPYSNLPLPILPLPYIIQTNKDLYKDGTQMYVSWSAARLIEIKMAKDIQEGKLNLIEIAVLNEKISCIKILEEFMRTSCISTPKLTDALSECIARIYKNKI